MTKEEIKEQYSMRDVAVMYGIFPNRAGFCRCPFHQGDRTASLKLYKDNFHCFGCGADGDIFKFVELMDECSFRQAFERLGGTYHAGKPTMHELMSQYRSKARRRTRENQKNLQRKKEIELISEIDKWRKSLAEAKPLSDDYAKACKKLQYSLYQYSEYFGLEK